VTAHLLIIHFPVSLILIGAVYDLLGVGTGERAYRERAGIFLLAGAVASFLAFVTGEGAKFVAIASAGVSIQQIEVHQQWGSVGVWALLGAALLRTLWRKRQSGAHGWLNLAVIVAAAVLVVAITVSGLRVRHGV
jgi:uncharacterized membrane protein